MTDVSEVYRQFMKDSYKAIQDAHKDGIEVGARIEQKRTVQIVEKFLQFELGLEPDKRIKLIKLLKGENK